MQAAASVQAVLARLAREGTVVARLDRTSHRVFPVAVSIREGHALRDWVVREQAARTIEIGLGYAVSTLCICDGLLQLGNEHVRHLAMDPYQRTRFANCGLQLLEEAGVRDLVDYVDGRSELVLPDLLGRGSAFELAFVDGNHRFDAVFVDLFYLGRLLKAGGIIFVDDYQLAGVRKAVAFYLTNLDWTLEETSEPDREHQWAVVRTSDQPDQRPFTYFVDFVG
jgi:predicted O-methyltransferase YrrM